MGYTGFVWEVLCIVISKGSEYTREECRLAFEIIYEMPEFFSHSQ